MTVMAIGNWPTNAHMIAEVSQLGYIKGDVLDATYGRGNFWTITGTPGEGGPGDAFVVHDLFTVDGVDFRCLPEANETYDTVVFDPPYKLSGTPALDEFDHRYGLDVGTSVHDKMDCIIQGAVDCARVTKLGGHLLVKCMDQVCSGQVVWQTRTIENFVGWEGMRLVDEFMFPSYRPQPADRRQVHARRNYSSLLVFRKQIASATTVYWKEEEILTPRKLQLPPAA